jgi:hypothetical protein
MLRFRWWLVAATMLLGMAWADTPPVTTIQDILYTADGNRFSGVATISWKSFEAGNTSSVAPDVKRVVIGNGNLFVQLVPTTTSQTVASYMVVYNTAGRTQFTEYWVVPPSNAPLRVRDVRLAPGGVTTSGALAANATTVQIADVLGLQNALNLRLTSGTAFGVSRAAVINAIGAVDGAIGNLSDCLRVDGTSGPCGTGGGSSGTFVDAEVPSGAMDGVNLTYLLANTPGPGNSLTFFQNGLLLTSGVDYSLSSRTVTLTGAPPQTGDLLIASYRVSATIAGVGFIDAETPAGTMNGSNTTFTLNQAPNPAASLAVYRNGIRQQQGLDYTGSANTITFASGAVPQIGDSLSCFYRITQ